MKTLNIKKDEPIISLETGEVGIIVDEKEDKPSGVIKFLVELFTGKRSYEVLPEDKIVNL